MGEPFFILRHRWSSTAAVGRGPCEATPSCFQALYAPKITGSALLVASKVDGEAQGSEMLPRSAQTVARSSCCLYCPLPVRTPPPLLSAAWHRTTLTQWSTPGICPKGWGGLVFRASLLKRLPVNSVSGTPAAIQTLTPNEDGMYYTGSTTVAGNASHGRDHRSIPARTTHPASGCVTIPQTRYATAGLEK